MDKVMELVVLWIHKNLKNPKLYAAFSVIIIIAAFV